MTSRTIILRGPSQRQFACSVVNSAVPDSVVTVADPKRNTDQNALMWVLLGDVSRAKIDGRKWSDNTWKCAFLHFLGHQVRWHEGLDDSGAFPVEYRSSRLTVRQMADLITCIYEYGDRHGVRWSEPKRE